MWFNNVMKTGLLKHQKACYAALGLSCTRIPLCCLEVSFQSSRLGSEAHCLPVWRYLQTSKGFLNKVTWFSLGWETRGMISELRLKQPEYAEWGRKGLPLIQCFWLLGHEKFSYFKVILWTATFLLYFSLTVVAWQCTLGKWNIMDLSSAYSFLFTLIQISIG